MSGYTKLFTGSDLTGINFYSVVMIGQLSPTVFYHFASIIGNHVVVDNITQQTDTALYADGDKIITGL